VGNSLNADGSFNPSSNPLDNVFIPHFLSSPTTSKLLPCFQCSSESHGTHVAGIIVASPPSSSTSSPNISSQDPFEPVEPFTGVAPDATLGAYRIYGCHGETSSDLLSAALYKAQADGSHIINLSLSGGPSVSE
jgi:hypothetical protein